MVSLMTYALGVLIGIVLGCTIGYPLGFRNGEKLVVAKALRPRNHRRGK